MRVDDLHEIHKSLDTLEALYKRGDAGLSNPSLKAESESTGRGVECNIFIDMLFNEEPCWDGCFHMAFCNHDCTFFGIWLSRTNWTAWI